MILRGYQEKLLDNIYSRWSNGARTPLVVSPTGSGKTCIFSECLKRHNGASCAIAHRQELVAQMSLSLAAQGVRHNIIGPKSVVKLAVSQHVRDHGSSFYAPSARCAVAGVDTLIRRGDALAAWLPQVTLWVMDEGHHVLRDNKWGRAVSMFPNARGLGVTATPLRTDGAGLGVHYDGVFDALVLGPEPAELMDLGYLTKYRVFAPLSDIDVSAVAVSKKTGDFVLPQLREAAHKSRIVGDVVQHYLRIAPGKLGITFATDVSLAVEMADKFNASGVPAAAISAKTPDHDRAVLIQKFKNRELLQLVNVDIFGEGFDIPALEVVSLTRHTKSFGLHRQQVGRVLRPMPGKTHGIVVDHVGSMCDPALGLPDTPQRWTLARRDKSTTTRMVATIKPCPNCTRVYDRFLKACPFCGFYPEPADRSKPEFVDGDLTELSPDVLSALRDQVALKDIDKELYRAHLSSRHVPDIGQRANVRRHVENQDAQRVLRENIATWAGHQRHAGAEDSVSYRKFYVKFGVDVMTAKTLKTNETNELNTAVISELKTMGARIYG